ncbi:hypothetical protein BDV93DRAFT_563902 [Ceratobasidium sp. AG-I]|nr:hypothetical protein BDV93DRAFT_563902 [Ceratobasidium sp. AG-I]
MHAEHCSSTGVKSNQFCRTCHTGGPQAVRQTEQGFSNLMQPGTFCSPDQTINAIHAQYETAITSIAPTRLTAAQRAVGVKDGISQPILETIQARGAELSQANADATTLSPGEVANILRCELNQDDRARQMNPLLSVPGLNVHLDTPIEILHTILLGPIKYFWRLTCKSLDHSHLTSKFRTRFNSLSLAGLDMGTDRVPEYICRYCGSLVGKHFRFVIQLIPFALYDLVKPSLLRIWLTLGQLTALLWYSSFPTMDSYIEKLSSLVDDFLHAVAATDPAVLIEKAKLHILVHAPFFARRFGPLPGPDSEHYESNNSIFRMCSILSNRSAPSLDTATTFSKMDRVYHVAMGGWWFDKTQGKHVRAGVAIREHFLRHPKDRRLLGIEVRDRPVIGSVQLESKAAAAATSEDLHWTDLFQETVECPYNESSTTPICTALSLIVQSGDVVYMHSDVIYRQGELLSLGRVHQIVSTYSPRCTYVVLHPFVWQTQGDVLLCMPAVSLLEDLISIPGEEYKDVQGQINLQHQCTMSNCDETGTQPVRQERRSTTITESTTHHRDLKHYLINVHSMHNDQLISDLLDSNHKPLSIFFPPDTHAEIRRGGLELLRTQLDTKKQKKEEAAAKTVNKAIAKSGASSIGDTLTTTTSTSGPTHQVVGQASAHIQVTNRGRGAARGWGWKRQHRSGVTPAHAGSSSLGLSKSLTANGATEIISSTTPATETQGESEPIASLDDSWERTWSPVDSRFISITATLKLQSGNARDSLAIAQAMAKRQEMAAQAAARLHESPPLDDLPEAFNIGHTVRDEDIDPELRELEGHGNQQPPSGSRRARSESLDQETHDSRGQKYGRFAEDCCDKFALRGARREFVRGFAKVDLHEKLIATISFIQRHESDHASTKVQAYVASSKFKKHACEMFQTALLAPHNRAYVNALGDFIEASAIIEDMIRNPELYNIKKVVLEDADSCATLISATRSELTTLRNQFKTKLALAHTNKLDINAVVKTLAPKSIEITEAHLECLAWLIEQHVKHKEELATGRVKDTAFWSNIDKLLAAYEINLVKDIPDKRERDKTRAVVYKTSLDKHRLNHPPDTLAHKAIDPPSWQVVLEWSLKKHHSFL